MVFVYTEHASKIGFRQRQQPLPSSPPASINLFKLICFGAGKSWLKFRALPCLIPAF